MAVGAVAYISPPSCPVSRGFTPIAQTLVSGQFVYGEDVLLMYLNSFYPLSRAGDIFAILEAVMKKMLNGTK